jgi:hypothetical protein
MVGKARIMSYEAIVEAEQKQAARAAIAGAKRGRGRLQNSTAGKRSSAEEMEFGKREIKAFGLGNIVLSFRFDLGGYVISRLSIYSVVNNDFVCCCLIADVNV